MSIHVGASLWMRKDWSVMLVPLRVIDNLTSSMLCSSSEGGAKELTWISSFVTLCVIDGDVSVSRSVLWGSSSNQFCFPCIFIHVACRFTGTAVTGNVDSFCTKRGWSVVADVVLGVRARQSNQSQSSSTLARVDLDLILQCAFERSFTFVLLLAAVAIRLLRI